MNTFCDVTCDLSDSRSLEPLDFLFFRLLEDFTDEELSDDDPDLFFWSLDFFSDEEPSRKNLICLLECCNTVLPYH